MENYKLSYYTVITDVLDEEQARPQRILYSTRSGQAVVLYDDLIQNMKSRNFAAVSPKILESLFGMEAIIPQEEDELEFILTNNQAGIDDSKVLGFTIQPGASCQLGCGYCGQKHSKDYLSADLADKMLERIKDKMTHKPYRHLAINWYGGEPLMALKQIRELSPRLMVLAEEHGMTYSADMVTNALSLKKDIYDELVNKWSLKSFQVTIDGTAEYHDNRRYTKEGQKPTFDIIFGNILEITSAPEFLTSGIQIAIRCNADKHNIDGVIPFVQFLASHKLQDKINFYVAPIHDWGDNHAVDERGVPKDNMAEREIDWMMELIRLNFKVSLLPERKQVVCMVVDPDAEVYDAFGNVSTCWEIPYTPVYAKSDYMIGNLKTPDAIKEENIPMRAWNAEIRQGKSWCKTCSLLPVCGGSCPKNWLEGTPACPNFKYNINDRLILQYVTNKGALKELA